MPKVLIVFESFRRINKDKVFRNMMQMCTMSNRCIFQLYSMFFIKYLIFQIHENEVQEYFIDLSIFFLSHIHYKSFFIYKQLKKNFFYVNYLRLKFNKYSFALTWLQAKQQVQQFGKSLFCLTVPCALLKYYLFECFLLSFYFIFSI